MFVTSAKVSCSSELPTKSRPSTPTGCSQIYLSTWHLPHSWLEVSQKLYTVLSCLRAFTFCTCCILICLVCFVASFKLSCVQLFLVGRVFCISCLVCIVILCVFVVLCVYCCFFTLDDGLLDRSLYSEGPVTGHLHSFFLFSLCL